MQIYRSILEKNPRFSIELCDEPIIEELGIIVFNIIQTIDPVTGQLGEIGITMDKIHEMLSDDDKYPNIRITFSPEWVPYSTDNPDLIKQTQDGQYYCDLINRADHPDSWCNGLHPLYHVEYRNVKHSKLFLICDYNISAIFTDDLVTEDFEILMILQTIKYYLDRKVEF